MVGTTPGAIGKGQPLTPPQPGMAHTAQGTGRKAGPRVWRQPAEAQSAWTQCHRQSSPGEPACEKAMSIPEHRGSLSPEWTGETAQVAAAWGGGALKAEPRRRGTGPGGRWLPEKPWRRLPGAQAAVGGQVTVPRPRRDEAQSARGAEDGSGLATASRPAVGAQWVRSGEGALPVQPGWAGAAWRGESRCHGSGRAGCSLMEWRP